MKSPGGLWCVDLKWRLLCRNQSGDRSKRHPKTQVGMARNARRRLRILIAGGANSNRNTLVGNLQLALDFSYRLISGTKRTKNSRQRRLVRGDLPLRTPRRGCGKSEPCQREESMLDSGMEPPYASLRQRLRRKTASGCSTVSLPCGADLAWIYRASPLPSTL